MYLTLNLSSNVPPVACTSATSVSEPHITKQVRNQRAESGDQMTPQMTGLTEDDGTDPAPISSTDAIAIYQS
jgi:hypothetical protein